ncbi:hypothetical protein K378_04816 [Streptomyces sp. Amel2xB2]|uniref:hypothetical protein n=1 Tax=Streptomyces sp. Amel2xB2 TaxID=1305829 RepID=UPI000DBA221C|nr:hypothetical protein [Streptomyces sp. Amel2xB2]RAJ58956.1 hypothetical protein K378_04816 [Streptomyces sp. Amel2xB2]
MGVFARLLRRSSGSPRKPAAGAVPAPETGADDKAKEEKVAAAGAGDGSEDVGIPKQQSADGAADSEAADDARN